MKKSIVYSFAALASFPVLAEAANVDLPEDKWGGAYVDGKVQSTDGSVLKQSVELVQGKYKVTVKNIIVPNGGSVTVKAGSASKEIKANGSVTLDITLASKTNVNVSVEGSGIFTFEDATIELDFDFAKAVAALQQQLNGLTETLKTYEGEDKKKENEQAAGLIQDKLNLISASQSYQDYANYALYDLANSSLTADINKLAEKAAADETDYIGSTGAEELTNALTDVKEKIKTDDPNQPALVAKAETIAGAIADYKGAPTEEKKAAITKQIGDLKKDVDNSNASLQTYKDNVAAIAAATAAYNTAQKTVSDLFLNQEYKTYGNIYKYLFTNAKAALAAASKKIANAQAEAVAAQNAYTIKDLTAEINDVATEVTGVAADYTDNKTTINGKYEIAAALQKSFNEIKAVEGAEDWSLRESAQGAIKAVKDELDSKNNAEEEVLNYTPTKVQAANDAIAKYKKAIEYNNEYVNAKNAAEAAKKDLASALEGLDFQKYQPSSLYEAYTGAIAKKIEAAQKEVEEVFKANQDAKDKDAFNAVKAKIDAAKKEVADLKDKATAANKTYKQVFEDAATLQEKLDAALAEIATKSPDVAAQYKGADIQTKITGWEATFDGYNKDLAADKMTAPAHADNVAKLALDGTKESIKAEIDKLVKDAEAAQTAFGYMAPYNLRDQLEKQIDPKLKAINELKAAVDKLAVSDNFKNSVNYAKLSEAYTKLAGDVTKVDTDAKAAMNNTPLSGQKTDDDIKKAVEVNKDVNAKLATYIATIAKLTTDLNASQKAIQAAIDAVVANENAKTAYDKRKAEIKEAIAKAKITAGQSTSEDATDLAAAKFGEIEKEVDNVDKAVTEAYNKQNLTENVWKDRLNDIVKDKGSIATTLEAVKAAQANYEAYASLNTTAATAKTKIEGCKDQVGPTKYYNDLVAQYLKELETEKTNIENFYKAKTAVANKEALEKAINAIIAKAELIKKDAPANEKAYRGDNDKVKGQKYDVTVDLQGYYDKISFEIKSSDASTLLEDWTTKLDAIQSKINKLAADVDSYYNNGQSVAKAGDVAKAITDIKKELADLLASQKAGYDKQIADDNAARYKNFTVALTSAQEAFKKAVETQNTYSKVTNPDLKKNIEDGTATLITELYKYPALLAELETTTKGEYLEVTSPDLYNETEAVKTAKQYAEAIKGIQGQLTVAALAGVSFDDYEEKVNTAVAELNGEPDIKKFYTDKDGKVQTAVLFEDVQKIINDGKTALGNKNIAGVDGALNDLADIKNMIAAVQHEAANAQLSDRVQKLKDAIEDHLEFLAGLEGQEELIKNYNTAVKDLFTRAEKALDEAQVAGTCFVDYDALDGLIDKFEDNPYVGDAKTMFETANNLPATQKLLDEAIAEVSQYHVAPNYAGRWDFFQKILDEAKADPSVNISNLAEQIKTARSSQFAGAYGEEFRYLQEVAPVELQDQYNQLVADQFAGMENDDTAILKGEIEKIKEAAGGLVSSGDKKATPAELVEFNGKVAALFTEIQALYAPEIAGVTADALKDDAAKLAEKLAKLDGYVDVVKANAGLDAAKADIQGDIDAVNADITKYADNIVYYSDKIQGSIDYIDDKLDGVINYADDIQEKYDDNKVVYDARIAEIEALQAQLDKVVADFEALEILNKPEFNWYSFDDNLIQHQKDLDKLAGDVEADNAKLSVQADYGQAELAEDIERNHDAFSYEELSRLHSQLDWIVSDISWDNTKYSKTVRESLFTEKANLEGALFVFRSNIDADQSVLNEEAKMYENLSAERFAERMETVTAIRARIDALKKIIENVTLGDINGDGKVSVNDYTAVVDYIINEDLTPAEGTPEFDVADVNADGKLNIADATALINIILTGDRAGNGLVNEAPARVAGSSESVNVEASDMGNGVTRLAIALDNASNYVSCQMDVKLPAGMKLVGESVANRADGHELASGDFSGGIHRIVVSSITNTAFAGNSGAVLYIDVETDDTYAGGKVIISDVIFVTPSAQVKAFSIAGEATGITGIATDNSVKGKIYDLSGRVLNAVKKGFNVINGKKVFVK